MADTSIKAKLQAIDDELENAGIPLRYRPLECFKRLYGVVDQSGRELLFDPLVRWYLTKYGDDARWDGTIGRCPILIRGKIYLGVVRFTAATLPVLNSRDHIEALPDDIASSLSESDGKTITEKLMIANLELRTLYNLTIDDHSLGTLERGLVGRALHDLENAAVTLKHTGDTQTTIVQAHEAAEKFLKAALLRAGSTKNPKSFSHDIPKLFRELVESETRYAWLREPIENLQRLAPTMDLRYQPTARSLDNAVGAFYAALHVCGVLANMWLFDLARGTRDSSFEKGKFYVNGAGLTFYCRRVCGEDVILRLFHLTALTGMQLIDIRMKAGQSAMYLEVTDKAEIEKLKRRLLFQMKNRGKKISPDDIGLKIANGPEGSYVSARFKVKVTVREQP